MKKILALLFMAVCGLAQAQLVDTNVPGIYSADTPNPNGSQQGTWAYDVSVIVIVTDRAGTTATQATINVNGGAITPGCSGRGCQPATRVNNPQSVTLTEADGSQPVNFTGTSHVQGTGLHATYSTWAPDGTVPVGTYTLHVTGTASCIHIPLCSGDLPVSIVSTTTSTPLALAYFWTSGVSPLLSQAPFNIQTVPVNVATLPGDASGPQQVCDLYDGQLQSALQAFYDSIQPGAFQIDAVTSTANPTSSSSWACQYTIMYQDLVNAPGVENTSQTDSGLVSVGSGPAPFVFQAPQDD